MCSPAGGTTAPASAAPEPGSGPAQCVRTDTNLGFHRAICIGMLLRSSGRVTGVRGDQPRPGHRGCAPRDTGSTDMANQTWEFREFPGPKPNGEDNAVVFLNEAARQGRGEATATLRNDGSVGLFYLVPGSLGTDTAPTWEPREFSGPNGEKNAVIF